MTDWRTILTEALLTLTPQEEKVIRLRDGLGNGVRRTYEEIATVFRVLSDEIREIENVAREKLHEEFSGLPDEVRDEISRVTPTSVVPQEQVERIERAVAQFNRLTPELIEHIQRNEDDINDFQWQVVEHLVAELLTQQGFEDVRLVGRNHETGADVYACRRIDGVDMKLRFYVEVKHVRGTIGIDAVRLLYGAMTEERAEFGWNSGILVTSGRIANFRRGTRESWELKGVALRDRQDLFRWLSEYRPNDDGLWLPTPEVGIPESMPKEG